MEYKVTIVVKVEADNDDDAFQEALDMIENYAPSDWEEFKVEAITGTDASSRGKQQAPFRTGSK